MVVFPQAPELSTGRPQIAKNRRQVIAQEKYPLSIDHMQILHTSTTPYYN